MGVIWIHKLDLEKVEADKVDATQKQYSVLHISRASSSFVVSEMTITGTLIG